MKITRFTHAAVLVETKGVRLAIDPGEFGQIPDLTSVDAVLITHDHFDHIAHNAVAEALAAKPELIVYGPASLAQNASFPVAVVDGGDSFDVGGVHIEVVGHFQDVASLDDPAILNVGFMIDDRVLHPGDALQEISAEILLLPMEAPWAKNIDYERALEAYPPKIIIPIHDATLGTIGIKFEMHTVQKLAERVKAKAILLRDGKSVEL